MTPKRFFFILVGALIAIMAIGGGGYYWALQQLQASSGNLAKRLADQQLTEDQLDSLQNLNKEYKQLQPYFSNIDEALPTTKQESELALQLQTIAGESSMTITAINFAPSSALPTATSQTIKSGDILAVPVSFNLSGTYDQLQTFLRHQEKLSRYTSVSTLSITRSDKGGLTFTITLNAFVKP